MGTDADEVARDVELGRKLHRVLIERLDDIEPHALMLPCRLPDWTRAHVVTHLARNADGHRRMIEGASRGEVVEQYEGGVEGRTRDIEEGARRAPAAIIADFVESIEALEAAWSVSDWHGFGIRTIAGESPIDRLAFLRVREVSLHGVDLDIGIELADLDPLYIRLELTRMEMLWKARQPMGMTPVPDAALAASPPDRLGWFTGRHVIAGLPAANIF